MAPEALDSLNPEERHQLYRILRLRVAAGADRTLAVEGILGAVSSGESETITWVIPLLWKASSSSRGISERSPRTIPRTTAASWGLRP
jgi:protein gp37